MKRECSSRFAQAPYKVLEKRESLANKASTFSVATYSNSISLAVSTSSFPGTTSQSRFDLRLSGTQPGYRGGGNLLVTDVTHPVQGISLLLLIRSTLVSHTRVLLTWKISGLLFLTTTNRYPLLPGFNRIIRQLESYPKHCCKEKQVGTSTTGSEPASHHGAAERVDIFADNKMFSMQQSGGNLENGRPPLQWPNCRTYAASYSLTCNM